ncbi:MAG: peptide chain release factor N(5)-glutamine methyltransferase [Ruminococcaceae bacterium]|nr:peptide chain release factor N(5)-glutamine methyltransferase [Oscillospiraceae bacterium]
MTIDAIKKALADAGIENCGTEARILAEEFSGEALEEALSRRINREPLQYIIGRWPFYREEYFVSPACLIPRSDTEVLVDYLVKNLKPNAHFLDLCTGSGCIAVSLAKNRPDTVGCAADISEAALELARKNALHNKVRIEFFHTDVKKPPEITDKFDCIVSNPPYIASGVVDTLEAELFAEPRIALDGGEDGMDFYRAIVENYKHLLNENGFFAFEFGFDQKESAAALALEHGFGFKAINDYGGNFRVAILENL